MFDGSNKELSPENRGNSKDSKSKRNKKNIFTKKDVGIGITIIVAVICVGVIAYCCIDTLAVGAASAISRYQNVKQEVSDSTYEEFYQKAYDISEANHHVSNQVSITLGSLKEQAKMEVLKISTVEYKTPEDDEGDVVENILSSISTFFMGDVVSWLEVPGYGVFTVDLQSAEFIIDNERGYVLIRLPYPELSEFTIDYENVEVLNFEDSGIFKNSAKVGEDLARKQLQSAELTMRQNVNSNQKYYQAAENGATNILLNLVKQLNPQIENLVVDVEFIE